MLQHQPPSSNLLPSSLITRPRLTTPTLKVFQSLPTPLTSGCRGSSYGPSQCPWLCWHHSAQMAPWGQGQGLFSSVIPNVYSYGISKKVRAADLGHGEGTSPGLVRWAIWEKQGVVAPKTHLPQEGELRPAHVRPWHLSGLIFKISWKSGDG